MGENKSWLNSCFTSIDYENADEDVGLAVSRRRKAIEDVKALIREKSKQQITAAIRE